MAITWSSGITSKIYCHHPTNNSVVDSGISLTAYVGIEIVSAVQTNNATYPNRYVVTYNVYLKYSSSWPKLAPIGDEPWPGDTSHAQYATSKGVFDINWMSGSTVGDLIISASKTTNPSKDAYKVLSNQTTTVSNLTGKVLTAKISKKIRVNGYCAGDVISNSYTTKNGTASVSKKSKAVTLYSTATESPTSVTFNAGNATENPAITFTLAWNTAYNSAPKMKLQYQNPTTEAWVDIATVTPSNGTTYTWQPGSATFLNLLPNSASGVLNFRTVTLYGSTAVGVSDYSDTLGARSCPGPLAMTITDAYAPTLTISSVTGTNMSGGKFAVNLSKITVNLTGAAKTGATLKNYTCKATENSLPFTTNTTSATTTSFTSSNTLDTRNSVITATVTDSRGFTTTVTNNTAITDNTTYIAIPPEIVISAFRYSSSATTPDPMGTKVAIAATATYYMSASYSINIYASVNGGAATLLTTITMASVGGTLPASYTSNYNSYTLPTGSYADIYATIVQGAFDPVQSNTVRINSLNIPVTLGKNSAGTTRSVAFGDIASTTEDLFRCNIPSKYYYKDPSELTFIAGQLFTIGKSATTSAVCANGAALNNESLFDCNLNSKWWCNGDMTTATGTGSWKLGGVLADYVIDEGSGASDLAGETYEWRKWASGRMEIWHSYSGTAALNKWSKKGGDGASSTGLQRWRTSDNLSGANDYVIYYYDIDWGTYPAAMGTYPASTSQVVYNVSNSAEVTAWGSAGASAANGGVGESNAGMMAFCSSNNANHNVAVGSYYMSDLNAYKGS